LAASTNQNLPPTPDPAVGKLLDRMADSLKKAGDACRVKHGGVACDILDLQPNVLRGVSRIERDARAPRHSEVLAGEGAPQSATTAVAAPPSPKPRRGKPASGKAAACQAAPQPKVTVADVHDDRDGGSDPEVDEDEADTDLDLDDE
jgi:hypothetical protein